MANLLFIKQYLQKPRTTGAILPSSERLANKMVEDIDFSKAKCIVEYGPGTGVFTEQLISNRRADTILLLVEYNRNFCEILKKKYRNYKNIYIINDSAENVEEYLQRYGEGSADYIVSGLPFASLPKEMSANILSVSKKVLRKDGKFITFQYTLFRKSFINSYFNSIYIKRVLKNVPPAYVLTCND